MRRAADGTVSYDNDCTVRTFAEITGVDYEDAVELLREAAGYRPGKGIREDRFCQAFEAAGFRVTEFTRIISVHSALDASRAGRSFCVIGRKGRRAHAWSITGGKANRPYQPPFSYRIFEVA